MSTTHHLDDLQHPQDANPPTASARVTPIDVLARQKRLNTLLTTRTHLAMTAGEQASHSLPEAVESYTLQLVLEGVINEEYPAAYETRFHTWLESDPQYEHAVGVLTKSCSICRSIAQATGVNLEPPEAA